MNRRGLQTSEFWVTALTTLFAILNGILDLGINGEEMAAIFGAPVAFVVSRGLAKIRTPSD